MASDIATSVCLLLKEIRNISVQKLFKDQVEIELPFEHNPFCVRVWLKPQSGYFKGTKIPFKIELPKDYPRNKPTVHCEIILYHPNVSASSLSVCFSMFSSDWHESYRLEHFINGLLWLLNNPNFNDPLNSSVICNNYKINVRKAVRGLLNPDRVQYPSCMNNELGQEELKQLEEEDQLIINPPAKDLCPKPLSNPPTQSSALQFVAPSLRTPIATLIQQHRQRASNSSSTPASPTNPAGISSHLSRPPPTRSATIPIHQHTTNFTSNVDRSRLPSVQSSRQYFQRLISLNV